MASEDKYDRQLRLWGARGQKTLSQARVCLLNAGGAGSETLKNLVLPGIGRFTIVDDAKVDAEDCSNNFFVTRAQVGQPRAKVVRDWLVEMNPDVEGEAVEQDVLAFMQAAARHSQEFSLVIATQCPEPVMVEMCKICKELSIPLVCVRAFGLIGYVRLYTEEICIVESKPSPEPMEDIRIANPFPQLVQFVDGIHAETLDDKDYKHVPYVVTLVKQAKAWSQSHGGKLPSNAQEKRDFKDSIKALARMPWGQEENLEEALKQAYLAFGPRPIPYDVQDILNDPKLMPDALEINEETKSFWILAKALKLFVEQRGVLPLSGRLPDMIASTSMYTKLQEVYNEKATLDKKAFMENVEQILAAAGRPVTQVTEDECALFCKHARDIQVRRYRTLEAETTAATCNREAMAMATMEGVGDSSAQCPLLWYLALRACDRFELHNGRVAGANKETNGTSDAEEVMRLLRQLCVECGVQASLTKDHAAEITRYAGKEVHNVCAVVGGIASQEAVKLITHKFTPLNNTLVFNGINCSAAVYEL